MPGCSETLPIWMEYAKAVAPILFSIVAICISYLGLRVSKQAAAWQAEKVKEDRYGRRFDVYMAFHELRVLILETDDIDHALKKANSARAHAPFLFNKEVTSYLENLHTDVFRLSQTSILLKDQTYLAQLDPEVRARQITAISVDRLALHNRIDELVTKFKPYLQVRDLL